jgi:adenine C2-methylase RlmN of 23S rRNA A2503 and tRNA A37
MVFNIGSQSKKEINYEYVGIHKVNDKDKISEQNLFFIIINLPVYVNLKK